MSEMEMVKVVYVGRKPTAIDNVASSGKSWAGAGDVQEVSKAQAKILTRYADQWALADTADAAAVNAPEAIAATDADGETTHVLVNDLDKPLEKMSKVELVAVAKKNWRRHLDPTMPKKLMIDQIEEWQKELGE